MITTSHPRRGTKAQLLLGALEDRQWHDTQELVRRVGHTFGMAKFQLGGDRFRCTIQKRHHPARRHQWQYRLID